MRSHFPGGYHCLIFLLVMICYDPFFIVFRPKTVFFLGCYGMISPTPCYSYDILIGGSIIGSRRSLALHFGNRVWHALRAGLCGQLHVGDHGLLGRKGEGGRGMGEWGWTFLMVISDIFRLFLCFLFRGDLCVEILGGCFLFVCVCFPQGRLWGNLWQDV